MTVAAARFDEARTRRSSRSRVRQVAAPAVRSDVFLVAPLLGSPALAALVASTATPVMAWVVGWGSFSVALVVELLVDAAIQR